MTVYRSNTDITPKEANYDESRLTMLEEYIQALIDEDKLQAGGYLLAKNNDTFAHASLGNLHYNDTVPFGPDSIIRIASITKSFAGIAMMQLMEDGKLRLDEPVSAYLPEFGEKPYDTISIAHLLSHTSGLMPDGGSFPDPYGIESWAMLEHADKYFEGNWIKAVLASRHHSKPEESWAYSSMCYTLLGEIITRVSGEFANDYVIEHIVRPLGLKDTFFEPELHHLERMYYRGDWDEERIKAFKEGKPWENEGEFKLPSMAGGLYSTLADLAVFGKMLLGKGTYNGIRILGRKAFELMISDYTNGLQDFTWGAPGDTRPYGAGMDMHHGLNELYSKGTFGHEGWGVSMLLVDPVEDFICVWFAPFREDWRHEYLFQPFALIWSGIK